MNTRKKLKILGVVLAFILCFPFHFLYDKFPCFITSIFAPVNESIFEHMKILFGSVLLSGVVQKIITKIKHLKINNVCISNFIASLTSIPIFLIIFLPIYNIIGENFIITIFIMLISIILAEIISYKIMGMKDFKMENIAIIFTIIIYLTFAYFTYNPIHINFFKDTITNTYGIKK